MKTIYKYEVKIGEITNLNIPAGAQFLHIDSKVKGPGDESFFVWFYVDPHFPEKPVEIMSVGTGWQLPDSLFVTHTYIGSVVDDNLFVWHFFISR